MNDQSVELKLGVVAQLTQALKIVTIATAISFVFGFLTIATAQSGSVSGQVIDAATGNAVAESEVILLDDQLRSELQTATTDQDGRYEFQNIESGTYILHLSAANYLEQEIQLSIENDQSVEKNIWLNVDSRGGANFSSVTGVDKINYFGDYSVESALTRFPGMQVSRDGEINHRGVGLNNYAVTVNGQRLANSGLGNRSFDLGSISTDIIQALEVKKVVTPDMEADALSGVINVNTQQTAGDERTLSAWAGGGINTQYGSITEPESRFWINYAERFWEDISVALTLSFQQQQKSWEELGIDYGLADFGNGPVDAVEEVAPALHNDDRKRFGGSFNFQYDPTDASHYYLQALFTTENRDKVSHTNRWQANADWVDPTTTGAEGGLGMHSHNPNVQDLDILHHTIQAGGKHFLESLDLSYSAGWSQSIINNYDLLFPFEFGGYNLSLDWEDRDRPYLTPTNQPTTILENGAVRRSYMVSQDFERIEEEHIANDITARIDVEYPIGIGSLKAGTSARMSYKTGDYDENHFEFNRTLRMLSFNMLQEPNRDLEVIGGDYRLPWLVNTSDTRAFFENQRPLFTGNNNLNRSRSDIRNYHTAEQVYAGYAMATLEFGQLEVIGGIRAELTNSEYEGYLVDFDDAGEFLQSEETTESDDYLQLFPNAQLAYHLSDISNIRLSYSRTMARPDYYVLTPFQRINHLDSTVYRGNPQLEPLTSDNLDLMFEHTFSNSGRISIGAFYKELNNFVVERQQEISGGALNEYEERAYQNSNASATVFGAEVALHQQLTFLPGIFNRLNVFANYTWSDSEYNIDRSDETALPGQSPHVVNAALGYKDARFSAQIAYHWTAEYLSQLEDEPRVAPAINASGGIYMDYFADGYQDLSISAEYRLSPYFKVWANVKNLLMDEPLEYAYDRQLYPTSTYVSEGFDVRLGVRFDL